MFASEYGYTINQFASLTMKEIVCLTECIAVRLHNEYIALAKIQHPKLKVQMKKLKRKVADINEAQEELMRKAIHAAAQRKVLEKVAASGKS